MSDTYQYYLTSMGEKYIKIDHGDNTATTVPNRLGNADFDEIMRQVEAGTLTMVTQNLKVAR